MAINFPSTAGQATDGTFTYTVAGITYSWDGSSWRAAGSGATATDKTIFSVSTTPPGGSGSLTYNSNTGVFAFTPPNLTPYFTLSNDGANSGLDADLLDGQEGSYYTNASNLGTGTIPSARLSGTYNINISGSASSANFGIDALNDVTITTAANGQILSYNGSQWVNTTPSSITGLQARTTASVTASNLTSSGSTNLSITTPKTYALLKIQTSHAAWVTLYTDTASRTADASRTETTDPLPGSGVIAEVITSGAVTQLISPGTIGYNSDGTGTTYIKVVNKSGATASIQVTLHYVQLEA